MFVHTCIYVHDIYVYIYIYTCIYAHGCLDPSQTECDRFRPPCDLATIVEVFGGRVFVVFSMSETDVQPSYDGRR